MYTVQKILLRSYLSPPSCFDDVLDSKVPVLAPPCTGLLQLFGPLSLFPLLPRDRDRVDLEENEAKSGQVANGSIT